MGTSLHIFLCFLMVSCICCEEDIQRNAKFSVFQIIKFKNEPCVGTSRNGTCFTSAECDAAGGTESGTCADGFGVCCTAILEAGASTSLNQSYIVQDASSSLTTGGMMYKVCPCSSDVCRIRFDFTTFNIAGPVTAPGSGNGGTGTTAGTAIGDCLTDQFSVSSSQGGSPIICGVNNGQHMIVDTDTTSCSIVNFALGGGSTSRSWDIMVTQYKCGDESGGPSGCLQWHMEPQGQIRSFNFPSMARGATGVADSVVHLSNQMYNICIRKPASSNHICYTPCNQIVIANVAANSQSSFGVSEAPAAANANPNSGAGGSTCTGDYIEIIGGMSQANAAIGTTGNTNTGVFSRYCGRELDINDNTANAAIVSVCTASVPFRVGVQFNADEATAIGAAASMADTQETFGRPGGIIGFSLCYTTPGTTTG